MGGKMGDEIKRRLPLWSKVLITAVVIGLSAAFALGVSAIVTVQKLGKEWKDPVAIARVAHRIADLPEPLPAGYNYIIGIHNDFAALDIVSIEHSPDKQLLTFQYQEDLHQPNGKELLDRAYSTGLMMSPTRAQFTDVLKNGKTTIGSSEMQYLLGHTTDIIGSKGEGLVGLIVAPVAKGKKNILIYAFPTSDVPYNQQITMDLLNSIKGFGKGF
jgi:hypothetical protein